MLLRLYRREINWPSEEEGEKNVGELISVKAVGPCLAIHYIIHRKILYYVFLQRPLYKLSLEVILPQETCHEIQNRGKENHN